MAEVLEPGSGLIYMKIGNHAQETLQDIISRKRREIEEAGYALWGYGGNTCHPLSMVQPFARSFEERGGVIYLCMEPMTSNHMAPPERAYEESADGHTWRPIPAAINVRGSRFALAIEDLDEREFELPLGQTRVAVGNSQGKRGDRYVIGRVDKACLEVTADEEEPMGERKLARIGFVARLKAPYAVLVRSRQD